MTSVLCNLETVLFDLVCVLKACVEREVAISLESWGHVLHRMPLSLPREFACAYCMLVVQCRE